MRDIKFRGKAKNSDKWYIGDFISDTNEFNRTCDEAFILPHWNKLNSPIQVIKETVGQYTGLKDKNGVEIYEGDLIDFGGGPFKVVFEKGCFYSWTPYDSEFLHMVNHLSEVIGNIYENPELLEAKE